jgi:hypothetical protein
VGAANHHHHQLLLPSTSNSNPFKSSTSQEKENKEEDIYIQTRPNHRCTSKDYSALDYSHSQLNFGFDILNVM